MLQRLLKVQALGPPALPQGGTKPTVKGWLTKVWLRLAGEEGGPSESRIQAPECPGARGPLLIHGSSRGFLSGISGLASNTV